MKKMKDDKTLYPPIHYWEIITRKVGPKKAKELFIKRLKELDCSQESIDAMLDLYKFDSVKTLKKEDD